MVHTTDDRVPAVLSASQARAAVTGSGLTPAWLSSGRQSAGNVNAEPTIAPAATPPVEEPRAAPAATLPVEGPPAGRKKHRIKSSLAKPPEPEPRAPRAPPVPIPPAPGDYGLAVWRACFYGLMYLHWRNSEVHAPPGFDPKMFGYDQFWWVPPLMPQDPAAVVACRELGGWLALLAAAGVAFPLTSGVYTLMAGRHLFASITHFTNHSYLFVLLSLLTCCSGASRTLCPSTGPGPEPVPRSQPLLPLLPSPPVSTSGLDQLQA